MLYRRCSGWDHMVVRQKRQQAEAAESQAKAGIRQAEAAERQLAIFRAWT
jgi:hypothetical protein